MNIDLPLPLLGGLSPARFVRSHWQRNPFLIRGAWPGVQPPVSRAELFALAARDDVESRLLWRPEGPATWRLAHGPFPRRRLPALNRPGWTLLVQGLDLHVPTAHEMLSRFRFVPQARLDDLMISYASDGGGVGPHVDAYDVFLLQVHGRRRWRVGRVGAAGSTAAACIPDLPVKILQRFEPASDWLLEPGDMLYLPPGWGHDGVAEGECMTCSIGFRAPGQDELAREVLLRWAEAAEAAQADGASAQRRYKDPAGSATATPGRIPRSLGAFAASAIEKWVADRKALDCALGEVLTEPKRDVWFDTDPAPDATMAAPLLQNGAGVRLDRRTRMMYDGHHVFVNGESFVASGRDARLMRRLADERRLSGKEVGALGAGARALMEDWAHAGWIHGH